MAIVRVQGNARGVSTGSSIVVTLASAPTEGNVLIMVVGGGSSTDDRVVSSIAQTGVTWTKQVGSGSHCNDTNTWTDVEVWLGVVGSGASDEITVTLSDSWEKGGVADVCEYSGIASNPLDKSTVNPSTSTGYSHTTGTTAITTQDDELWIGGIVTDYFNTVGQTTPLNGFTLLDGAIYNNKVSLGYLEKIVSATGTAGSGTSWTTNPQDRDGCIATFKASVGIVYKDVSGLVSASGSLLRGKKFTVTGFISGLGAIDVAYTLRKLAVLGSVEGLGSVLRGKSFIVLGDADGQGYIIVDTGEVYALGKAKVEDIFR